MSKRARNRAAVNRERAQAARERAAATIPAVLDILNSLYASDDGWPRVVPSFVVPFPETHEEWQAQGFTFALDGGASVRERLRRGAERRAEE